MGIGVYLHYAGLTGSYKVKQFSMHFIHATLNSCVFGEYTNSCTNHLQLCKMNTPFGASSALPAGSSTGPNKLIAMPPRGAVRKMEITAIVSTYNNMKLE